MTVKRKKIYNECSNKVEDVTCEIKMEQNVRRLFNQSGIMLHLFLTTSEVRSFQCCIWETQPQNLHTGSTCITCPPHSTQSFPENPDETDSAT